MQAAMNLAPPSFAILAPPRTFSSPSNSKFMLPKAQTSRHPATIATAVANEPSSTVDYSSITSVFPAEACETVGGDACAAEMYPEAKLKPESETNKARTASETVDREYLDYNGPKTVFPGEACDDLGGEFCEPEYQTGVY